MEPFLVQWRTAQKHSTAEFLVSLDRSWALKTFLQVSWRDSGNEGLRTCAEVEQFPKNGDLSVTRHAPRTGNRR